MHHCRRKHLLSALLIVHCAFAHGFSTEIEARASKHKDCIQKAAERYDVDPNLLKAIGAVESGFNASAIGKNTNGTEDLGVMQINSSWLPKLHKYGITRDILLKQPCTNIHVGAWILADNIKRLGPTWNAVGAYNAMTPSKREVYVHKVWRKYMALTGAHIPVSPVEVVAKPALRLI